MGLRRTVRKLGKAVRGGVSPTQVFVGCFLGFLVGMIPGINLIVLVGLFLLFFLSVNRSLALLGIALGKALCLALAPVTFEVGYALVHQAGLEGLFRAAASAPVLALMNLHVYCVAGGLPFAIVLGIVFGWLVTKAIVCIRLGIVDAGKRSEKMERLSQKKIIRFLVWFVFGPKKADLEESVEKKKPLVRKFALVVCVAVVALVALAEWTLSSATLSRDIEQAATSAAGAEVNVAAASLSLLGGKIAIEGLQVTDAEKPTHNKVAAKRLAGSFSYSGLFSKSLVIDHLVIDGLATDQERAAPGNVLRRPPEPPQEPAQIPEDSVWRYLERTEELEKYRGYFAKARDAARKLKEMKERRAESASKTHADRKQALREAAANEGYLRLAAEEVGASRPRCIVRKLDVENVTPGGGDNVYTVKARELSDRPEWHARPMVVEISDARGLTAKATFHFESPDAQHELTLAIPGIAVGDAVKLTDAVPVSVENANADLNAEGTFSAEALDLSITIHLTDLQVGKSGTSGALGMDADATREIFSQFDELTIRATLTGTPENPRVRVEGDKILADMRDSLVAAGKKELAQRAGKELDKALGDALSGQDKDKAGGLLDGVFKQKTDEEAGADKQQDKSEDPLKGLGGLFKKKPAKEETEPDN